MLIQKVFRSIDAVELETSGSMIDVVNRAEKRELVESASAVREIKDLRNMINHEYKQTMLNDIFVTVLQNTPPYLAWVNNTKQYCSART